MNLPPSLQKILDEYPVQSYEGDLIQAIAHEACQLQRESDRQFFDDEYEEAPLVVPAPDRSSKELAGCKHEWVHTGVAYGGDDESYHGEGRCYCLHCGADGDS